MAGFSFSFKKVECGERGELPRHVSRLRLPVFYNSGAGKWGRPRRCRPFSVKSYGLTPLPNAFGATLGFEPESLWDSLRDGTAIPPKTATLHNVRAWSSPTRQGWQTVAGESFGGQRGRTTTGTASKSQCTPEGCQPHRRSELARNRRPSGTPLGCDSLRRCTGGRPLRPCRRTGYLLATLRVAAPAAGQTSPEV